MNINFNHSDVKVGVQITYEEQILPVVCLTLLYMPRTVTKTHLLMNIAQMMKKHNQLVFVQSPPPAQICSLVKIRKWRPLLYLPKSPKSP